MCELEAQVTFKSKSFQHCPNVTLFCRAFNSKTRAKILLQLDQLIIYILRPGTEKELDQRCVPRLILALQQHKNPFSAVVPLPVQGIVSRMSMDDVGNHWIARAWWEYNGHTDFFDNPVVARYVRAAGRC